MASNKKKRVSKKNKASWRKHTDITDVEAFLADQRQDERIGTFSEKKDEDLFQIDVTATATAKKPILSAKKKRKANARKPLRTFASIDNTSKVKDPIAKRNHVKLRRSGRNKEEEVLNPKSQKHIQANKDRSKYYEKLDKRLAKEKGIKEFATDIWKERDVRERAPGLKNDWISKELSLYVLKNIRKGEINVHDSIRHKTTKAKALEPPHPGMSYNPSLKAHVDLITDILKNESNVIKAEEHLKRVTTEMFSKVTPEERDSLYLKEMSTGLPLGEIKEEEEEANADAPYKTINPPVENKKKSKKKRRKQKAQKVVNNELKKITDLKKQRSDIHRIKALTAEVEKGEEELNTIKKRRKLVTEKKKFETKRLGRLRFKEPEVDVNMPEDIAGNLRNVKVESSLLVDRFKNFQKRNLLPTTVEVSKRKPRKIKRFPRSTHKEVSVSISKKK